MLINAETISDNAILNSDIAIVGAGPAGIVLALELSRSGHEVALLESGSFRFSKDIQSLGDASSFNPRFHAPMSECTRRQIGGTSNIWGGRCVPYDPVDFDKRSYIAHSSWPVSFKELENYFQRTCDYFLCGDAEFNIEAIGEAQQKSIVPGLPDEDVLTSTLERWSLPTNFGREYLKEIKKSDRIKLLYGLTCTEIKTKEAGNCVQSIQTKTLSGKAIEIKSKKYILSCGALNTTRLLMNSDKRHAGGIGNHSGLLGKFYMGHLSGDIAVASFKTPPDKTISGFDRDSAKIYLRRRFSFTREFLNEKKLNNIVAWLNSPRFDDPRHGNGILSLAYLTLTSPIIGDHLTSTAVRKSLIADSRSNYKAHIKNLFNDIVKVGFFAPKFGYQRFLSKRKIPALFVHSASNEYPLHYHSEHAPNPNSAVRLSQETDELGMRRLEINIEFTQQDIESVIRAHEYWDQHLRKYNCGQLRYIAADPIASVWDQAKDGFHQIGTTRMADQPQAGVVGVNCNIHGFDDLFVASSSVFVTSGQANSTFMIVAFALRLADHLKHELNLLGKASPSTV